MIFSLIVWMNLGNGNVMTVQPVTAMACGEMRAAVLTQPETISAICAGDIATPAKYIVQGNCQLLERRDNFANFICTNPAPTWPTK